jgi:hypothetical protein
MNTENGGSYGTDVEDTSALALLVALTGALLGEPHVITTA